MDVYGTKSAGVQLEKCVYSLATHLATLIGQVEHQRPVLESVFHRLLVSPPPSARLEAVRSVHCSVQYVTIWDTKYEEQPFEVSG